MQDLCRDSKLRRHCSHEVASGLRRCLVCILVPIEVSCFLSVDGSRGHTLGKRRNEFWIGQRCWMCCRISQFFTYQRLDASGYGDKQHRKERRATVVEVWLLARGDGRAVA